MSIHQIIAIRDGLKVAGNLIAASVAQAMIDAEFVRMTGQEA